MTPVTSREIPDGFTLDYNPETWNVGHVFIWSDFYERYMKDGILSIRPGECFDDAFRRAYGHEMTKEYEIFFV